jgi:hypothetical protein
MALEF